MVVVPLQPSDPSMGIGVPQPQQQAEYWQVAPKRCARSEDPAARSSGSRQSAPQLAACMPRLKRKKDGPTSEISEYSPVKVIGAGAFGIVRLYQKKGTNEVYALKQINWEDMVQKNKVQQVRSEVYALSTARSYWVVRLHGTFQDENFFYMVMDYLPGGDLMTHLQRKGKFSEFETRFYIGELVLAVDYIHKQLGCVHHDIKPDNVVLDARGHISVVDFGLCIPGILQTAQQLPRVHDRSARGTPDYAAPEVFLKGPCGWETDWWSVGIIAYEMLFGRPPFSDAQHSPKVISMRVLNWSRYLRLPADPAVGVSARDLIRGLLCNAKDRLTAAQLRAHTFFRHLDLARMREMEAPIQPQLQGPCDTSHFDDFSFEEQRFGQAPMHIEAPCRDLGAGEVLGGPPHGRWCIPEGKRPSNAPTCSGGPRGSSQTSTGSWEVKQVADRPRSFAWLAEILESTVVLICAPLSKSIAGSPRAV